jgi:hypothetical protein
MLGATILASLPIASPPILYKGYSYNPKVLDIAPELKDIHSIVVKYLVGSDLSIAVASLDIVVNLATPIEIEVTDIYVI